MFNFWKTMKIVNSNKSSKKFLRKKSSKDFPFKTNFCALDWVLPYNIQTPSPARMRVLDDLGCRQATLASERKTVPAAFWKTRGGNNVPSSSICLLTYVSSNKEILSSYSSAASIQSTCYTTHQCFQTETLTQGHFEKRYLGGRSNSGSIIVLGATPQMDTHV